MQCKPIQEISRYHLSSQEARFKNETYHEVMSPRWDNKYLLWANYAAEMG
jgi:hypothetical protein